MIQLRFGRFYQSPSWPLKLRFGGQEPLPELPAVPNMVMVSLQYWQQPALARQSNSIHYNSNDIAHVLSSTWSAATDVISSIFTKWSLPELHAKLGQFNWQLADLVAERLNAPWQQPILTSELTYSGWRQTQIAAVTMAAKWLQSVPAANTYDANWQQSEVTHKTSHAAWPAVNTQHKLHQVIYGPRPAAIFCTRKHQPSSRLRFSAVKPAFKWPLKSRFSEPALHCVLNPGGDLLRPIPELPTVDGQTPIRPPIRKSYIMTPELRCYRHDGQEINIISASWSVSRSQWGASVSLVCASRSDRDLLFAGGPQLFHVRFNGFDFYCLAEEPAMDHRFGQTRYTVSGRASIAQLASPHSAMKSASNATTRSLAALITDELAGSGWSLQFDMQSFNVPAGAFNYLNQTPIEAISKLVSAIGGMIYAEGALKKLIIRPLWPAVPWAFDTANVDIAVHDSVILAMSESPSVSPVFNAVFVRGEQQGVECRIKQSGTAGDKLAPDVVDPLITDPQAARQRGTAVLAESGTKQKYNLTLPLMADGSLPPVLPGTVLGVTWQGNSFKTMVDSISITGSKSADGRLTIRQQIGAIKP